MLSSVSYPPSCLPLSISSPSSLSCTLSPSPPPSCPRSLFLSLLTPFSGDKGGLAVNGLNWHTQMHKLIHHTGTKLHKTDRRPFFISTIAIHSTLKARQELIWRGISQPDCRQSLLSLCCCVIRIHETWSLPSLPATTACECRDKQMHHGRYHKKSGWYQK